MKHISKEEFFKQLNSCEYGYQYLKLVNNPENHLEKKDKGEVHHIHPRSLGGDNSEENLVKLTTFNHCLAHVLLSKAAMQIHSNWVGKVLMAIIWFSNGQQFHSLSELEKITLEDIYNWSELVKAGHKKAIEIHIGTHHTKETKLKMRNSALGKKMSEEAKNKMRERKIGYEPWNKGKTNVYNIEAKNKMRERKIGHEPWNKGIKTNKPSWNSGKRGKLKKINNGIITKQVKIEELDSYLSNGWKLGMLKRNKPSWNSGKKEENKIGYIKVLKNHGHKWILPEELTAYLADGWKQKNT